MSKQARAFPAITLLEGALRYLKACKDSPLWLDAEREAMYRRWDEIKKKSERMRKAGRLYTIISSLSFSPRGGSCGIRRRQPIERDAQLPEMSRLHAGAQLCAVKCNPVWVEITVEYYQCQRHAYGFIRLVQLGKGSFMANLIYKQFCDVIHYPYVMKITVEWMYECATVRCVFVYSKILVKLLQNFTYIILGVLKKDIQCCMSIKNNHWCDTLNVCKDLHTISY